MGYIEGFYNPVTDKLFIVARQDGGVSFHPIYTKTIAFIGVSDIYENTDFPINPTGTKH